MSGATIPSAAADAPFGEARTYQLLIRVARPLTVTVGRFGTFDFPAGWYVYTGSAKRNLEARVRRHLSAHKTLRWHIDYLLAQPGVAVREVRRFAEPECALNQRQTGDILIPGFGASDCRAGCGSHLKRLPSRLSFRAYFGRDRGPRRFVAGCSARRGR
ncbi:GIY-YIG nuclease family protein [Propionivibrio dicarboxylicus]|uniref:Uri superfamily endonuclease n=1 Tax=Propionivibrio dicarboxylicus TaxID=83767 RepID=A0A1G8JCX8_9RHOO|nr:GIY-YIG nuclease family protein [Propionivibrio dicarboxylicus]SDI29119.1 Uri superfamily endonuclease [Propionivibrio dicarboxylicus]